MQQKYIRDAKRRLHWFPHYLQSQCHQCGAWLEELPTTATALSSRQWRFEWICVLCGFTEHQLSGEPLATFRPDPAATIALPGSVPLPWSDWRLPFPLLDAVLDVADRYADRKEHQKVPTRPSVLDHSGCRQAAWGSFHGDLDDEHGIRLALAQLRSAPRRTLGARQAALLAERAVLSAGAVTEVLRRHEPRFAYMTASHRGEDSDLGRLLRVPAVIRSDVEAGVRVAPVIGWGRLSVLNRYEGWLIKHGAHPWLSDRYAYERAAIPQGTEFLAGCIELSDQILQAFDLFQNADTHSQLMDDIRSLGGLMPAWRRLHAEGHLEAPKGPRRVKLPSPYWLTRWDGSPPLGMF